MSCLVSVYGCVQATEWPEKSYGLNNSRWRGKAKVDSDQQLLKCFRKLEGVQYLMEVLERESRARKEGQDDERQREERMEKVLRAVEFADGKTVRSDGHYIPQEMLDYDKKCELAIKNAHKTAPDGRLKEGFGMLPSQATGSSTTYSATRAAWGRLYHLVVLYKSEEELRAELGDFDWSQLEGLDDDDVSETVGTI